MGQEVSVEEYLRAPYTSLLVPDPKGGYAAEILEFADCFAEGETADAAMAALGHAASAWIRAALAHGQAIPPPLSHHGYGGNIALRIPKSLHRRAAYHAARNGVSLNHYLVALIAAGMGA